MTDLPQLTIDRDGTQRWTLNRVPHRLDGPAIISSDGTTEWWLDGLLHRADGPALETPDGTKEWWYYGRLHRLDGPAITNPVGVEYWYCHGQLHRDNDLPAIKDPDGTLKWFVDGKWHRGNGKDGKPQPTVVWADGSVEYYNKGVQFRPEDSVQHLKLEIHRLKTAMRTHCNAMERTGLPGMTLLVADLREALDAEISA